MPRKRLGMTLIGWLVVLAIIAEGVREGLSGMRGDSHVPF